MSKRSLIDSLLYNRQSSHCAELTERYCRVDYGRVYVVMAYNCINVYCIISSYFCVTVKLFSCSFVPPSHQILATPLKESITIMNIIRVEAAFCMGCCPNIRNGTAIAAPAVSLRVSPPMVTSYMNSTLLFTAYDMKFDMKFVNRKTIQAHRRHYKDRYETI